MGTISIVMPIYNTEEFLDESISSVLNQTYKDVELILINDNSSDKSKHIINRFKYFNNSIKVIHFHEHKGVGFARNKGVEVATGKYIYFMDSDDYLGPNTLQLLADHIQHYPFISGQIQSVHTGSNNSNKSSHKNSNMIEVYKDNKFNLIKSYSVLNRLFKKSFIFEFDLKFVENINRYTDLSFIVSAILNVEEAPYLEAALYYKRRRNDPISNPSLMQMSLEDRIQDFSAIYRLIIGRFSHNKNIHYILDNLFLRMYRTTIVRYFRIGENIDNVFKQLVAICKLVNNQLIQQQPLLIRKELKDLKKDDIDLYKRTNLRHHRMRKIKRAFKGKREFLIQIYRAIFLKLPIKYKTVVFESFLGKSYSDSPKYIYEYMIENNYDYQYVWIINEKKHIPGNPKQVKRFSFLYYYYLARAKYWVSNSRLPRSLNKRKENVYLQTWHGTPLKKLVFDMKDIYSADPNYKRNFYWQSRRWNYLSSPNSYSSKIFRRAFKYKNNLLEFGYPRNDILYTHNNKKDILALKELLGLPHDKKIILYAPTWRDDEFYERGKYKFSLKLDFKKLQEQIGDEYIVLLRMHYFIASELDISEYSGFAYDFSGHDDIAQLYLVSDILITDYSSVFFDYANLKRPILFYTYDLHKYRNQLRGFYFNLEKEAPGPLLYTNDEVLDAIVNIEYIKKRFNDDYEQFYKQFCTWDDGHAAKRTVKKIFTER